MGAAAGALANPAFSQVPHSPFATGAGDGFLAFSPSGDFLANTNSGDNSVSVFAVDQTDGMLTPVPHSPFATGSGPQSLAFSGDGRLLANMNFYDNSISMFSVAADGSLTPAGTTTFPETPWSIAFSPTQALLAVADVPLNMVSVFAVAANGALTAVPGSPFATDLNPVAVAFSPNGSLLATANYAAGDISVFSVAANGALTPVAGSPFAAGRRPGTVAFSPDGALLATSSYPFGTASVFTVAADGKLTPVAGSPLTVGHIPLSVSFSPGGALTVANLRDNTLSVFSVSGSTAPTPVEGSPFPTDVGPFSAAFSPSGGLLVSANVFANNLSVYSVGPPSAQITSPTARSTYALGGSVATEFRCGDAPFGPGIGSCLDQRGRSSGAAIDTATIGAHTFTVTATSKDTQTAAASVPYTVAGLPSVSIATPVSGAVYTLGQSVDAAYACSEGEGGLGLASCDGTVANGGTIDTAEVGTHSFTVIATSRDGLLTTKTTTYTVLLPSSTSTPLPSSTSTPLPSNKFVVSRIRTFANGTLTFSVSVPGPGEIDVLETAWNDNLARAASVLEPAPRRFVYARAHASAGRAGTLKVKVRPGARGRRLARHHRYRVTLRLWVSYTPTGGVIRSIGFYGLHLGR